LKARAAKEKAEAELLNEKIKKTEKELESQQKILDQKM
jgi:hypothetical protein